MKSTGGLPPFAARIVSILVPAGRRNEVMADLEESYEARISRLGEARARRLLYRELLGLALWRARWRSPRTGYGTMNRRTPMKSNPVGRELIQDLRYGVRSLLRQPTFTFMALGVLALGIGAPATVLTLVNEIFFQEQTHVEAPDRIVRLSRSWAPGEGGGALGNPDYLYYRRNASTLEGLAASGGDRMVAFTTDGRRYDQLRVLFVSDNYFHVLGVRPPMGRGFLPEENQTPGRHPVVVLSNQFWTRALGRDPQVLGREILLGDIPFRVVGVAPEGFGSLSPAGPAPDAWVPIAMFGALTRAETMDWWQREPDMKSRWLIALGRLAPGMTFEAARQDLISLGEALEYEGKSEGEGAYLQRHFLYSPAVHSTLSRLSTMLLVAVSLVLLVAAANVAVLLLSRATSRIREMGIRAALGAGRGRIVRQILVETVLLALAGGALGVALAFLFSHLAASLLPVAFASEFRPDLRVIVASMGLSFLTALAVGVIPALHTIRRNLRDAFQSGPGNPSGSKLRNTLVVGQVGLSVVLVAGAILFGRSFWTARTQDLGFETQNRLVLRVNLKDLDLVGTEARIFLRQALDRTRSMPGVVGAAATRQIPYQGDWTTQFDAPAGTRANYRDDQIFTGMNAVSEDYFDVAGIRILRGRPIGPEDVQGMPPVIVVNEALADAVWPGEDPLGKTLPLGGEKSFEVVGVARVVEYYSLGEDPQPQTYVSLDQAPQVRVHFMVQTAGPAASMAPAVETELRSIEPRLVFDWVTTMASVFEDETSRYEISAVMVAVFSGVALLLAAAGLYGTLSFVVARRTREIGIRMALGANQGRVAREVMVEGLKLVGMGIAAGLAGVVLLRGFTESLLYGIPPEDPLPLLGSALVLLSVAVLAVLVPARHATRIDPMTAMRAE